MIALSPTFSSYTCHFSLCGTWYNVCVCVQGCLVVLLLQQWLVRHLTKRMMQLMTSEAFIEHRSKIPSSYLENYLAYQAHFSLTHLIEIYHKGLASKWSVLCMHTCKHTMCKNVGKSKLGVAGYRYV